MSDKPSVFIALRKITAYLLDVGSPKGGPKARFFLGHGFRIDDPDAFASALARHAVDNWPGTVTHSPWGERHQITAPMDLPDGTRSDVLTVWEIRHGEFRANLITAYPRT